MNVPRLSNPHSADVMCCMEKLLKSGRNDSPVYDRHVIPCLVIRCDAPFNKNSEEM